MVFQLFYSSVAAHDMAESELVALLRASRDFNAANGLTGLLVYFRHTREFIQLLEGESSTVLSLMGRIQADPRHRDVMVESTTEVPGRAYPDWTMGFRIDDSDIMHEPAFNPIKLEGRPVARLPRQRSLPQALMDSALAHLPQKAAREAAGAVS
jgi:hypothetical protein